MKIIYLLILFIFIVILIYIIYYMSNNVDISLNDKWIECLNNTTKYSEIELIENNYVIYKYDLPEINNSKIFNHTLEKSSPFILRITNNKNTITKLSVLIYVDNSKEDISNSEIENTKEECNIKSILNFGNIIKNSNIC